MITIKRIIAISSLTLLSVATQSAYAQLPNCQSASSDSDGDGFGWENNASCRVVASSSNSQSSNQSNNQASSSSNSGGLPTCSSASSDPDGDGFGWENNTSCRVGASSSASSSSSSASSSSSGTPACQSASSDPDGDGFGWENNATCLITASSSSGISDDAGSATSNGISDDAGSATSNGISAPGGSTPGGSNNGGSAPAAPVGGNSNGGSFTADTGSGNVRRTSILPIVSPNCDTASQQGGDRFATQQVGDYQLMVNAWRAERAFPGYAWSQTVCANENGVPVSWSYDWGPGVPGRSGRASDDFYVRAYPELIYGIKDEFRTSAPKSEIGFPVRVDEMPTVTIDYAFNGPQFGPARSVDASVTSRFPNGTNIQGERNVAAESFLYRPTNGVCDDSLSVTRGSGGSNHAFEVMVWLDSGAERLPAAARDYVTTVNLRGASYDVYTKSNDERYIAFVARNPQNSGRIVWNDYMDWARQNAHLVEQRFGANSNSVPIQDSWCVANIIVGTEIFWGAGNFQLSEWTITQSQ